MAVDVDDEPETTEGIARIVLATDRVPEALADPCAHSSACYHALVEHARVKLDPKTRKHRLIACAKCRAPVASSAWSGAVLQCAGCGHDETRVMSLEEASGGTTTVAYRDSAKPRRIEGAPLHVNLAADPPGRSSADLEYGAVIDLLLRQASADEDFAAFEWARVWSAATLAFMCAAAGDGLRARVALETALEVVHTPEYRALLRARLAQHAASLRATGLAKKWLEGAPRASVGAIDSEVRAARAMIAYAKEEHDEVVGMTGDTRAGEGFEGAATMLAIALNIDANSRIGRPRVADDIVRECTKRGLVAGVMGTMLAFRVSTAVIDRAVSRVRKRNAWVAAVMTGVPFVYAFAVYRFPFGRTAGATAVAVASSVALSWWAGDWALRGSTTVRAAKKIVEWGGGVACVALPLLWLTRTSPPPAPPPGPPASDVSPSGWSPDP